MMHSRRWAFAAVLTLVGCGGRPGAGDREGMLTPLAMEPPPVYALIGAREDLGLSSEQVAALDSIAVAVQLANRPLIEQFESVSPAGRSGGRRVTDEGRPILEQIQANRRQAGESIHALLTEAQRTEVCDMFSRGRSGARARAPRRPPEVSDTVSFPRPGLEDPWYWCVTPVGGTPES